VAILKGDLTLP